MTKRQDYNEMETYCLLSKKEIPQKLDQLETYNSHSAMNFTVVHLEGDASLCFPRKQKQEIFDIYIHLITGENLGFAPARLDGVEKDGASGPTRFHSDGSFLPLTLITLFVLIEKLPTCFVQVLVPV